ANDATTAWYDVSVQHRRGQHADVVPGGGRVVGPDLEAKGALYAIEPRGHLVAIAIARLAHIERLPRWGDAVESDGRIFGDDAGESSQNRIGLAARGAGLVRNLQNLRLSRPIHAAKRQRQALQRRQSQGR